MRQRPTWSLNSEELHERFLELLQDAELELSQAELGEDSDPEGCATVEVRHATEVQAQATAIVEARNVEPVQDAERASVAAIRDTTEDVSEAESCLTTLLSEEEVPPAQLRQQQQQQQRQAGISNEDLWQVACIARALGNEAVIEGKGKGKSTGETQHPLPSTLVQAWILRELNLGQWHAMRGGIIVLQPHQRPESWWSWFQARR